LNDVTKEEIVAYARRDWGAVEELKRRHWVERKRTMTPLEALELAEGLRRSVRELRPDWPSEAERNADLDCHVRLARRLAIAR
jgi:hypothetical protein